MLTISKGSEVAYILYANYESTVRATQLSFLPFFPPTLEQAQAMNISLSAFDIATLELNDQYISRGMGYLDEQSFKVRSDLK
jgi:hypothetical protein